MSPTVPSLATPIALRVVVLSNVSVDVYLLLAAEGLLPSVV